MRHPTTTNGKIGFMWYSRPLADHELLSCQYDGPNLHFNAFILVMPSKEIGGTTSRKYSPLKNWDLNLKCFF